MRQSRTITERWQGAFHVLPGFKSFHGHTPFTYPTSVLIKTISAGTAR